MRTFQWVPSSWRQHLTELLFNLGEGTDEGETIDIPGSVGGTESNHANTVSSREDSVHESVLKLIFNCSTLACDLRMPPVTELDQHGHSSNSHCPCLANAHPMPTSTVRSGRLRPAVQRLHTCARRRTRPTDQPANDDRRNGFVLPDLDLTPRGNSWLPLLSYDFYTVPMPPPANGYYGQAATQADPPPAFQQDDPEVHEPLPLYTPRYVYRNSLPPAYEVYDSHPLGPPICGEVIELSQRNRCVIARAINEMRQKGPKATTRRLGRAVMKCVGI
jgi:hypothetical protein